MTTLIEDLNDLIEQFEGEKISKSILLDTLLNIVKHEKKSKKIIKLNSGQHDFLTNWLKEDLHLATKEDTIDSPFKLMLKSIIEKLERA
jgi:hypothetical protein